MLLVIAVTAAEGGQLDPQEPLPVALVVTYADGRAVSTVIGSRPHRSWTPMFPRIASWQPPPRSLSPNAIQYASSREGDDVRVNVSVLFGQPHQREEQVGELVVRVGAAVRVIGLRRFGIEPVRLSLSPVGSLALHPPMVENRTAGLTIEQVEPMTGVPPRYRVTVINRSAMAVAAFQIESLRDGRPSLSKREWDSRAMPIVASGERYTFDLPLSASLVRGDQPVSTESLDTIVLSSVLWDDGTIEGDLQPGSRARLSHAGQRAQLTRVIRLLEKEREPSATVEGLRCEVMELSIDTNPQTVAQAGDGVPPGVVPPQDADAIVRAGMQRVKDLVKQDLDALEDDWGDEAQRRVAGLLAGYRAWRTRLEP